MLYGNKESGPLHLKITVKKRGAVFVCQPPGVWGRLPDGFKWCVAVPWPKFLSLRLTHLPACLPACLPVLPACLPASSPQQVLGGRREDLPDGEHRCRHGDSEDPGRRGVHV
jgi:hypothetical protein